MEPPKKTVTSKLFISGLAAKMGLLQMVAALLGCFPNYAQQREQFSQYMFNQLIINPAYAGADGALSLTVVQRTQWTGIEKAPRTITFSGHTLFKRNKTGFGVQFTNDRIGVHSNTSGLIDYAYHLNLGKSHFLSFGLQGGWHNRKSDYTSLIDAGVQDPNLVNAFVSKSYFNVGTGLYLRGPKLRFGISAPELIPIATQLNDTLSLQDVRTQFFGFLQYKFTVSNSLSVLPSMLIKYLKDVPVSYDVNLNVMYREAVTFGVSYRKEDSIDFLFKGQFTPQLAFGYSYDYPIGRTQGFTKGSHEIMVGYIFRYAQDGVSSPRP